MKTLHGNDKLSRREREMMDIIYEAKAATAAEVRAAMASPPSYSAVRATLRVLVEKGHLSHRDDGPRYIYEPTVPREHAAREAMRHLLTTFFDGSIQGVVAALIEESQPNPEELDRMAAMIEKARENQPLKPSNWRKSA